MSNNAGQGSGAKAQAGTSKAMKKARVKKQLCTPEPDPIDLFEPDKRLFNLIDQVLVPGDLCLLNSVVQKEEGRKSISTCPISARNLKHEK